MTLRSALAVAAALLAAVAIGCGGDDDGGGSGPVKIRMGWGIPAEEIKYVMMRHPEVARNLGTAYDIDWHEFSGTALGVQGLAAGTLDCASVGGLSVANGIDRGADIVILGEFIEERRPYHTTAWMVKKDSGIDSVADLRGKTVATNAVGGSTDYLQDFYIERQAGLKPGRDYKKVEVPFGQMQETLLSGRVDVGLFPQPFYGAVNATGDVKPLFHVTDQIEPFVQIMNGCRRDFVEDHRAAMERFQEDWSGIAKWMADPANRDEVIAASAAATKIPADVLTRFLLTKQDYYRPPDGAVDERALQREWDFFRDRGGIKQDLKVSDHVLPGLTPAGDG
jgi:NitT/TauT family transport system substrate-binding protein/sulfonate transport system substrate-binding protein